MINAGVPTNLLETANEEERKREGGKKHRNETALLSKGLMSSQVSNKAKTVQT